MYKKEKICFVLTHIPNPRINKRINAFKAIMPAVVICARRASQNIWEPEHNDVKHVILDVDLPSSSQITKRIAVSAGFRKEIYKLLEWEKPSIVYCEGMDTVMVAVKYKKTHSCKLIFEVSDLRESFIEKPHGIINRCITTIISKKERKLFNCIDKLVITSPKFFEMHYCKLMPKEKTVFVPNAPDISAFSNYRHKEDGRFTVGFIGGIRYLNQMKMLVDVSSELEIEVLFAGAGGTNGEFDEIMSYCNKMNNVRFTGRYDYKKDIANLYGMVDCIYSVYNADNANVKIALPNKLYEAVYCKLPIIVAKGTYLEENVLKWGVGLSVSHKSPDELKEALYTLKDDLFKYNEISKACDRKKADIVKMYEFNLVDALLNDK